MYNVLRNKSLQAEEFRRQGFELSEEGKYQEAIEAHTKARHLHEELRDLGGAAGDVTNIAIVYERLGEKQKALELHHEALKIDLQVAFQPGLRIDYTNLARLYVELGEIDTALEYQEKLIETLTSIGNLAEVAAQCRDKGFTLAHLGRHQEAIAAHTQAKLLNEKIGDLGGAAGDITNIAIVYEEMSDQETALKLHEEALSIDEAIDFKPGLRIDYNNLSRMYASKGDLKKSQYYRQKFIEVVALLDQKEKVKSFCISTTGAKGEISITRTSDDKYAVGYRVPSPVRRTYQQFLTMVNDTRLKDLMQRIEIITETLNESRKLRSLNQMTSSQNQARQAVNGLTELGTAMYSLTLPSQVKKMYRQLQKVNALELGISDSLVQYPWELMHDGINFLCLENALGRYVISDGPEVPYTFNQPKTCIKVLVVGDPCKSDYPYYQEPFEELSDLPGAREEAESLARMLGKIEGVEVKLLVGEEVNSVRLLAELSSGYDFIHFSGHATFSGVSPEDSGLVVWDGIVRAYEIMQCITTQSNPPLLAFINACESSKEVQWEGELSFENQVFGLASSFLKSGVNYIGSTWPIYDATAVEMALDFYQGIFQGAAFGEALRQARKNCYEKYKGKEIAWASYVLYGDPTLVLQSKLD